MSTNNFVPRVTQIDSVALDKEVIEVLKTQIENILNIDHGSLLSRWGPEINALLRVCLWKFSVHNSHSTFGQQMLNLKYEGKVDCFKSYVWCLLTIIPSYVRDRLDNGFLLQRKNRDPNLVIQAIQWTFVVLRLADVYNFLMFLRGGRYTSLADRVLKMHIISASKQARPLGYNYMTRELIWHTLIELLGNVLPLINYYSLKKKLYAKFSHRKKQFLRSDVIVLKKGMKCAICQDSPILPHHIGCSHIFCFYCIQGSLLADNAFQCPLCNCSLDGSSTVPLPCSA